MAIDRRINRRAVWLFAASLSLLGAPAAHAQPATCSFRPEFEALRTALLTGLVGDCAADERTEANGDILQDTSHGVLVKRKLDGRVGFTDGFLTWLNGPDGVAVRLNTERLPWEDVTASPAVSPPAASQDATTGPAPSSAPATAASPPAVSPPQASVPATTEAAPSSSTAGTSPSPPTRAAPDGVSPPAAAAAKLESSAVLPTSGQLSAVMSILSDAPDIGDGFRLGGLSGLSTLDRSGTSFVSVTDRGPNQDVKVRSGKASAFLYPTFVPSIVRLERAGETLRVVDKTPLQMPRGRSPVTGGAWVSGFPLGSRDAPAYDADGRRVLGTDPNGVDPEGIAIDPRDQSYWIGEEYGPSILHVDPKGTIITRLVPQTLKLSEPGYDVLEVLPEVLLKRKTNRGFEGISVSPDGKTLFAIMQSPLSDPSEQIGESSRNVRLVVVDISGQPKMLGMYLYQNEEAKDLGAAEQDDIKVGDLAAISNTRLLVAERDSGPSSQYRKVYAIELEEASKIVPRWTAAKKLEQMSDNELRKVSVKPMAKIEVVDLAALGFKHELVEGLAIVDDQTLAVVNDNNFTDESSELMLVRLPSSLQTAASSNKKP